MKTLKKNTATPKLFIGIDIHKRSWKIFNATDIATGKAHTFPPYPEDVLACGAWQCV